MKKKNWLLIFMVIILACSIFALSACATDDDAYTDDTDTDGDIVGDDDDVDTDDDTDDDIVPDVDENIGKSFVMEQYTYTVDADGVVLSGYISNIEPDVVIVQGTVTIGDTEYVVHSIGDKAFFNNTTIISVIFIDSANIVSIGDSAFANCTALATIDLSSCTNLEYVGQWALAYTAVQVVSLPAGIDYIGDVAFATDDSRAILVMDDSQSSSWNAHWASYSQLTVHMPVYWGVGDDSVVASGDYVYLIEDNSATIILYTGGDSDIVLPACVTVVGVDCAVTALGDKVFYGSTTVSSISVLEGNSLASIGESVLYNCYTLASIDLSNCTQLEYIGDSAFYGSRASIVCLPSGIDYIGDNAFYITYPCSIFVDEECKPEGWSDSWVNVSSVSSVDVYWGVNINSIVTVDDFEYTLSGDSAVLFSYSGSDSDVTVPATITVEQELYTVVAIGFKAFYKNTTITSVTFAEGNSIASIGDFAFYNCTKLTSICGMTSVVAVGEQAFYTCYNLSTVDYGSNPVVQSIGVYAFGNCSLDELVIHASIVSIGEGAYYNAISGSDSTSIYLTDTIEYIGESAFHSVRGIVWVHCYMDSAPADWDDQWSMGVFVIYSYVGSVTVDDMQFLVLSSGASLVYCSGTDAPTVPSSVECNGTSYDVVTIEYGVLPSTADYTDFVVPDTVTYIGMQYISDGQWYQSQPDGFVMLDDWIIGYNGSFTEDTALVIPEGTVGIVNYSLSGVSGNYIYITSLYVPDSVLYMFSSSINGVASGCIIYVESSSQPDSWSTLWNSSDREVVWGAELTDLPATID